MTNLNATTTKTYKTEGTLWRAITNLNTSLPFAIVQRISDRRFTAVFYVTDADEQFHAALTVAERGFHTRSA